jgi:hypothetical protein
MGEDILHLLSIMDIPGQDVLPNRIAGGSMDQQTIVCTSHFGQFVYPIPDLRFFCACEAVVVDLVPRPVKCVFGVGIEIMGVVEERDFVVALQAEIEFKGLSQARHRIRSIADYITQTKNLLYAEPAHMMEHGLQAFQVPMKI